jgi:hypothetical protein
VGCKRLKLEEGWKKMMDKTDLTDNNVRQQAQPCVHDRDELRLHTC